MNIMNARGFPMKRLVGTVLTLALFPSCTWAQAAETELTCVSKNKDLSERLILNESAGTVRLAHFLYFADRTYKATFTNDTITWNPTNLENVREYMNLDRNTGVLYEQWQDGYMNLQCEASQKKF